MTAREPLWTVAIIAIATAAALCGTLLTWVALSIPAETAADLGTHPAITAAGPPSTVQAAKAPGLPTGAVATDESGDLGDAATVSRAMPLATSPAAAPRDDASAMNAIVAALPGPWQLSLGTFDDARSAAAIAAVAAAAGEAAVVTMPETLPSGPWFEARIGGLSSLAEAQAVGRRLRLATGMAAHAVNSARADPPGTRPFDRPDAGDTVVTDR